MAKEDEEKKEEVHITRKDVSSQVPDKPKGPSIEGIRRVAKDTAAEDRETTKAPPHKEKKEDEPVIMEKMPQVSDGSIMLVDDDELILAMYTKKLEDDGFTVRAVNNGSDAFNMAREAQPDVIFLDVVMAGKNGAEILSELKGDKKTQKIPVVMFTNFSKEKDDKEAAKKFGAYDYLIKSDTDPPALSAYVSKLLGKQK